MLLGEVKHLKEAALVQVGFEHAEHIGNELESLDFLQETVGSVAAGHNTALVFVALKCKGIVDMCLVAEELVLAVELADMEDIVCFVATARLKEVGQTLA